MQNYCDVIRSHYHNNLGKEISDLKEHEINPKILLKVCFFFFEMQICLFFDSFFKFISILEYS